MPLVFLTGGARSGKSRLAGELAARKAEPVVCLATGEARDDEMAERIERHRRERPEGWRTVEEPLRLREAVESAEGCLIVDCLSLWVANALEAFGADQVEEQAALAAAAAAARDGLTV